MIDIKEQEKFVEAFDKVSEFVHHTAIEKGWYDIPSSDERSILLMHSELSEATEALRHGNQPDDKIPEFSGLTVELADTVIRIMDFAALKNLDVATAIIRKVEYNITRPYKHGGKKF